MLAILQPYALFSSFSFKSRLTGLHGKQYYIYIYFFFEFFGFFLSLFIVSTY